MRTQHIIVRKYHDPPSYVPIFKNSKQMFGHILYLWTCYVLKYVFNVVIQYTEISCSPVERLQTMYAVLEDFPEIWKLDVLLNVFFFSLFIYFDK